MTSQMRVYFMSLVGAISGLTCWSLVTIGQYIAPEIGEDSFHLDTFTMTILGGALGALAVAFADRWTENELVPSWIFAGLGIGLAMGFLGGILSSPIQTSIGKHSLFAARVVPWAIAGELIGFGAGIRWVGVSRHRPLIAMFGGLVGATIGGIAFHLSKSAFPGIHVFFPIFSQASALVLTGVGITCGITLAPALLSGGVIRFVSSADPRAQNKHKDKEWDLLDGDKMLVGSQQTRTKYRKDTEVFLADNTVAARHAFFLGEKGSFYIENHSDNTGPNGIPIQPLMVGDSDVIGIRKLSPGDLITLGSTQLRFQTKKGRGAPQG